jgi:hypothetical protein
MGRNNERERKNLFYIARGEEEEGKRIELTLTIVIIL